MLYKPVNISTKVFRSALREWRRCTYDVDQLMGANLHFKCPACYKGMHSCHCDGNRKVYRYARQNQ